MNWHMPHDSCRRSIDKLLLERLALAAIARVTGVSERCFPMMGFGPFNTARRTLRGIEAMSMIRKGQVNMKGKMTSIIAGTLLAIIGATLAAAATVSNTNGQHLAGEQQKQKTLRLTGEGGLAITTTSDSAEVALANHLKQVGAKMYGAFWCSHCHDQKQLFGKEAFQEINYIECDPKGKNPKPDLCEAAKVQSFPTWEIKGQSVSGTQSLEEIAVLSGYQGPRNFQTSLPREK